MHQAAVAFVILHQLFAIISAQSATPTQSAAAISSSLSSGCVSFISEYPLTVSKYASQVCQVCQNLQISPSIEPCCTNSNPTACFASDLYGVTVSDATRSAPIVTSAASLGSVNCDAVISIYEVCEAKTPGFDGLCFQNQQSCFCSTSGTAAPSYFDNFWSSCLAWASTASPSQYSLLGPSTNGEVRRRPCESYSSLIATGGAPWSCATLPSNSLTTTSLASTGSAGLVTSSSSGVAVQNPKFECQRFVVLVMIQVIVVYVQVI